MDLQTILVGADLSSSSEAACGQAVAVARRCGARVVLAHATALPDAPDGIPASMQATADAYLRVLRDRATADQRALAALGERLSGAGVEVSQVLVDGFADEALLEAAARLPAELLVVGSHGRRGLGRLLLGSVAERLVRAARLPVLIARGAPDVATGGYHRVVVATDFSPAADRGLALALQVAAPDAAVEVVHAWQVPSLSHAHASDEVEATLAEVRAVVRTSAEERGRRLLHGLPPTPAVTFASVEGDPQDVVLDRVATGAYLVVVGGHGTHGVRRLLLGSVAEAIVRHAPCSVLVAP